MSAGEYEVGDLVLCRTEIYNDGGVPDVPDGFLLATPGARGIVVRVGAARPRDGERIYMVRFEGPDHLLGPPVGCLESELTRDTSQYLPR